MGSFKLGKMTLRSLFGTPETTCYPVVQKAAPVGRKGHIVVDMSTCILCGLCVRSCPAHAIEVDKKGGTWAINQFQCVTCGACVRACPKKSLEMNPDFTNVSTAIKMEVYEKPQESEEEKAAKEAAKQSKAASDKPAELPVPMTDEEIEAKVASVDPSKADKVRAALKAKQKKDLAAIEAAGK